MMRKNIHLKHVDDDELKDINPSCMWGLINAVDYHHWHYSVKRMLPYKRSHVKRAKGHQIPNYDYAEHQVLLYEEEKRLPVDQSTKKGGSNKKRSIKARLKNLLAHHSNKGGNGKHQRANYSSRSALQRTYSIHHLELPNHDPAEKCSNWEHPIIFLPGKKEVGAAKLQDPGNKNGVQKPKCDERFMKLKDKDGSKEEEFANVLEIFKVDKKLFLEILQNANHGIRKSSSLAPSKAKARLIKSGSFPATDLSRRRSLRPSKLKHKQSETWCTLKWEKFPDVTHVLKDTSHDFRDLSTKSGLSAESIRGIRLGRALSLILERSDHEEHGEEILPSPQRNHGAHEWCGEINVNRDGGGSFRKSREIDEYMLRKQAISHRRSTSLNESLDKYAALFENNFGKEGRLQSSRSLRLRNEDEMQSYKNTPRLFSRIRSVSNLDLYSSLQNWGFGEANFADWPITSAEDSATSTCGDSKVESSAKSFAEKIQEVIQPDDFQGDQPYKMDDLAGSATETFPGERSDTSEDFAEENDEHKVDEINTCVEQDYSASADNPNKFQQSCPISAPESSWEVKATSIEDFEPVEGLENKCKKSLDNFLPLLPGSNDDTVNIDDPNSLSNLDKSKSYGKDDADLDYIRHLLEFSGIIKDAFCWKWHSDQQPLKPSLFDEACRPQDLECFTEDLSSFYYYQLLFDVVNEELVHLYDRSSAYYPKALSYSCRVRPFPVGNHILEEICGSISKLLNLKPEEKPALDSVIDFDLRKDESWMNLQWESESVALEVDHMIFDQLLEEIIC